MKHATRGFVAALALTASALAAPAPAFAQATGSPPPQQIISTPPDFPRGKISGYFYIDYYYNAAGDPVHRYAGSGSDSSKTGIDGKPNIGKDLNGFLIRRVYFQHDADLSARFSTRVRLEVDSKSLTSDGKLGAAVKAAYVQAKNVIPRGTFYMGVLTTPIWENAEEFWGYRSIEKTLADFRGLGSSADIGVQMKGALDPEKRIGYSVMIGNGPGQKPEDNRYKKCYLSLPLNLVEGLKLEPYVDYEPVPGKMDRATYKLFGGYERRRIAVGGEIVDRVNHNASIGSREPFGYSIFARWAARADLGAFARVDGWQPDTRAANRVDSRLWIAGVDWQPYKDVHVMPNLEGVQYQAKGTASAPPHPDLQARVTLYWKFSKP
ncbi:MAG TPA: hypothetical protein VID50_04090 [Candidatus Eisenbacteria bacterium]|jgi:hypothetical protein